MQQKAAGAVLEGSNNPLTTTLARLGSCGTHRSNIERDLHRAAARLYGRRFASPSKVVAQRW